MADTIIAVTSSTKPYLYDLPHILSLPIGFEARFRYFVDWVAPEVASAVDRGSTFAGRDLVLLFHSLDTARLLPIRRGEVIELKRRGPMYHLRFLVQEFPDVGADLVVGNNRQAARQRDGAWLSAKGVALAKLDGHDLSAALPKGTFLQEVTSGWESITRDEGFTVPTDVQTDRRWAAMAALIMEEERLRDVPLFFLQGLVDRGGAAVEARMMKNHFASGTRSGSGFRLISGARYRLQLLQWRADVGSAKAHRVVCETDRATVAVEGESGLVLGKYDVLEYAIRAEGPGYSEMSLHVERSSDEGEAVELHWPELYSVRIPVQVNRNKLKMAGMVVLALLGLGLYAWPMTPFAPGWVDETIATLAQLVGLGCLFAAYGGFLSGYVRFASQAGRLAPGVGSGET